MEVLIAPTGPDPKSIETAKGMKDVGELVDYVIAVDVSGKSRQEVVTEVVSVAMAYFERNRDHFDSYKAMVNERKDEFSDNLDFLLRATIR